MKMRKHVLIFFCVSAAFATNAANVIWNVVSIESGQYQTLCTRVSDENVSIWAGYEVAVSINDNLATLTPNPDGSLLIQHGSWMPAQYGELVSSDTMLRQKSYFEYGSIDPSDFVYDLKAMVVETEVSQYLKFIVQSDSEIYEYLDGRRVEIPTCYYGWAEYLIESDGTISILSSALELDGGSIFVGGAAIPEPTSGVLFVVGIGLLALRRKFSNQMVENEKLFYEKVF